MSMFLWLALPLFVSSLPVERGSREEVQRQIDAAPPGGLVILPGAVVSGPLVIKKPITIRGQGVEATTLDGMCEGASVPRGRGFDHAVVDVAVESGVVHLEGMTITGGCAPRRGGGVHKTGGGTLELTSVHLTRNRANFGAAAIEATGGRLVMSNVEVTHHSLWEAVRVSDADELLMTGCNITQNRAGIFILSTPRANISRSRIVDNRQPSDEHPQDLLLSAPNRKPTVAVLDDVAIDSEGVMCPHWTRQHGVWEYKGDLDLGAETIFVRNSSVSDVDLPPCVKQ